MDFYEADPPFPQLLDQKLCLDVGILKEVDSLLLWGRSLLEPLLGFKVFRRKIGRHN